MPNYPRIPEAPAQTLAFKVYCDRLLLDDMDSHDMELAGDIGNARFIKSIRENTHALYALVQDELHEGRDQGI